MSTFGTSDDYGVTVSTGEPQTSREIERIETEVSRLEKEIDSMIILFQSIIDKKLYEKETPANVREEKLSESVPSNKIDRIIHRLKKCIGTMVNFKKDNLSTLDSELEKL